MNSLRGGTWGSSLITIQSLHCSIDLKTAPATVCPLSQLARECCERLVWKQANLCVPGLHLLIIWLYAVTPELVQHTEDTFLLSHAGFCFSRGQHKYFEYDERGYFFCQNMQCCFIPSFLYFSRQRKQQRKILILNSKILLLFNDIWLSHSFLQKINLKSVLSRLEIKKIHGLISHMQRRNQLGN